MNEFDQVLQIQLADGRTLIARPRPEDQDFLRQVGDEAKLELSSSDYDTEGHGPTADLTIDVEGHAMTLRLPTSADAEALRKLLMVGAMSATIVAAGAIASLQPTSIPATNATVHRGPAPVPMQDFQQRREDAIDEMLAAPPPLAQPSDVTVDDAVHGAPIVSTGGSISASQVAPAVRAGTPTADFRERREQAVDDMLEAPAGEAAIPAEDGSSRRVGGPQD